LKSNFKHYSLQPEYEPRLQAGVWMLVRRTISKMHRLAFAAFAVLICVGQAWAAEQAGAVEQRDEALMFKQAFPNAELVDCNVQKKLTVEKCEDLSAYIKFVTWRSYWIQNSYWVREQSKQDLSVRDPKFERFPGAFDLPQDISDNLSEIRKKYGYPSLAACIKGDCQHIINFQAGSNIYWANVWADMLTIATCINSRDLKNDTYGVIMDGDRGMIFGLALEGKVGDCPPAGLMLEAFEMGARMASKATF
jgi:hypothetical protein